MKRFKCKECGYIHIGDESPAICPVCGFDSEVFYEMIDTSASQDSGYIDMIDNAGDNTIKLLRQKFDYITELAAISLAMSKQAKHEVKCDEKVFSEISSLLIDQASITAMILGEFLEFNTESNISTLKVKIKKAIDRNSEIIKSFQEDGTDVYIENLEKENKIYSEFLGRFK